MKISPVNLLTPEKKERWLACCRFLGSIILATMNDPTVTEIMVNPGGLVFVERLGKNIEFLCTIRPSDGKSFILSLASFYGESVTREKPYFEGVLPESGARIGAVIPPASDDPVFSIRMKASAVFTFDQYEEAGIINARQKTQLQEAVTSHKNILVVGGTGSGKTTLTNAFIHHLSIVYPTERLIIIEDTYELQSSSENTIFFHAYEDVSMLSLLARSLRFRPDRILVGEVRGGEALSLLKAWNTGHPGGIATIHANSAYAGLLRLEGLIAEATVSPMQQLIAETVHVVVYIEKTATGRIVKEILSVHGYENGRYITANEYEDKQ
jgi:P-type conjugative transfer ATPase TrbB